MGGGGGNKKRHRSDALLHKNLEEIATTQLFLKQKPF